MSSHPEEKPFSESNLDSPEYRQRLLQKLNTLIAVLEVACAKVRRSLAVPDADIERLTRIQKNLNDTLHVCLRARRALERRDRLPKDLPQTLSKVADPEALALDRPVKPATKRTRGVMVEMQDSEELEKFRSKGPIDKDEIGGCDLDELGRLLQG